MEPQKQSFLQLISQYWFLILFLGGMAVTWGSFSQRISVIESKITIIETRQEKADEIITSVQGDLREIKTSLEFIKERLQ